MDHRLIIAVIAALCSSRWTRWAGVWGGIVGVSAIAGDLRYRHWANSKLRVEAEEAARDMGANSPGHALGMMMGAVPLKPPETPQESDTQLPGSQTGQYL